MTIEIIQKGFDAIEAKLAERRPDAVSYAGFLDRERRGVQKVSA